jgi:hypothetical protein
MMGLASQVAKAGAKKAGKSSSLITDLAKAKSASKAKEITPEDITEYIKTTLIPKKESDQNFKSKFKDTTVVDEKNKPRVMYHGRNKDFESFDTGNVKTDTQEIGTHIGTADQANEFATREGGNVVPTYLDVKNPLRLNDWGGFHSGEVLEQLRSRGGFDEDLLDEIEDIPSIVERNKAVVDLIKGSGYDGIVYLNKREGLNLKGTEKQKSEKIDELQDYDDETLIKKYVAKDSYIIFDPAQAKSIFNKGSWSGSDDRLNYNKGGTVNDMNRLFAEGGINDQGGTVDPVSGNDVPPGSLQNEVRDDIDVKISEGEFVVPADVVRYIGLERLMKLRDEAKQGLARMNEIGQMGNAQEVANPEALHNSEDDGGFTSEVDDIMEEVDMDSKGIKRFDNGGFAVPGADLLSKYNIPKTSITNPALDVRAYKNAEGRVMYITFFNDKPSIAIPAGYEFAGTANQFLAEVKKTSDDTKKDTTVTATETIQGGDGVSVGGGGPAVGGSGIGTGTGIGNSAIGIAIGAVANAVSNALGLSSTPNDAISVTDATPSPASVDGIDGATDASLGDAGTANANATAAAAANAAAASINADSLDADSGVSVGGSGVGTSGGGGDGSAPSGGGIGDGGIGSVAKGGLITKRMKKPAPAQKRGIASKR